MRSAVFSVVMLLLTSCASTDAPWVTENNPIPPQRLHWPNTVIQHHDSKGNATGYSVVPYSKGKR
jgi:hypothetical protein